MAGVRKLDPKKIGRWAGDEPMKEYIIKLARKNEALNELLIKHNYIEKKDWYKSY
ncbi:MAG: hypothetical protein ACLFN5_03650 [bacterium]